VTVGLAVFRGWFVQWDLVCDREYLKDLSQTILVVGVIFGAMVFTSLSDHLGRKPVFLFTQWALAVVGVANAFVPNYHAFLALRFCTGALQQVYKECAETTTRPQLCQISTGFHLLFSLKDSVVNLQ